MKALLILLIVMQIALIVHAVGDIQNGRIKVGIFWIVFNTVFMVVNFIGLQKELNN